MKNLINLQSRSLIITTTAILGFAVADFLAPAQAAPPSSSDSKNTMVTESSTNRESLLGSEIKVIQASGALGVLFGWRYIAFENDKIGFGGAGYTGQLGSVDGSFSYGGFQMNYQFHKSEHSGAQIGLLAGGGGGNVDATSFGGVVLEPQAMYSWFVGKTVRASLAGSYLWMPGSPSYSAPTVGIRFDFLLDNNN